MKVLVCTPCYGGLITQKYFMSFYRTTAETYELGWRIGTFTLGNESNIQRGRNTCAAMFLKSDWDKLFFIDADITWTLEDFKKIVESPWSITGGVCPLKRLPIELNFNVLERDMHFFPNRQTKTVEGFRNMAAHYNNEFMPVAHLGTAFMCIDRNVFEALKSKVPEYTDKTTGQDIQAWDFFPSGVKDGDFRTEDYGFCELAAKNDFVTHISPDVIVEHTGTYTFKAD